MEDFGRFSHHRDLRERRPRGAHTRPARGCRAGTPSGGGGEGSEAAGTPWPPRRHHHHQSPPDSPRESRSLSDVTAAQRPPDGGGARRHRPPRSWRPREAWGEPRTQPLPVQLASPPQPPLRCRHCPPAQGDSPPPYPEGACTPLSGLFGADEAQIGDPWALPAGCGGLDRWSLSSLPSEERSSAAPSREFRMLSGCAHGPKRDTGDRLAASFASQSLLQPARSGREARSLHTQMLKNKLDEAVLSSRDRKIVALVLARLQKAQRMRELQRQAAAAWEELKRSDRKVQATLERERRQLLQQSRAQWQREREQRERGEQREQREQHGEQRRARRRARDGQARHADGLWGAPEDHDRDAQQQQQQQQRHDDRLERVAKPRRPGPVLQRLLWERQLEQELEQELELEKTRARPEAAPKPRRPGLVQRLLREQERKQELELELELEQELEKTQARTEPAPTSKPRRPGPVQRFREREQELEQELELEKNLEETLSEQRKQPSLEQQQQQQQEQPARRLVPSTTTITTTTTTCPKQQAPPSGGHKKVREANLSSLVNFQARKVLMDCQVKAEELLRRLSLEQSAQRAQEQLHRGLAGRERPHRELRELQEQEEEQCQQELEEQRRVRRRLLGRLAAEQKVQQARELRLRREQSRHVLKLKAEKEEKCHVEGIKEAIRKKEQRTEQLAQDKEAASEGFQKAQLRGGGY